MGVGEERLGAIAGPLHRAPHPLGGPQRHHFLGVDEDLRAEAAADIGRHHPQLVLMRDVVERRQHQAGDMRILRRGVEGKMLLGVVVFADRRARLHRVRHQPVVGDVERNHVGRRLERGIRRGFLADGPVVDHVARGFRMQLRRARLDCGADIGRNRQFLIVDDDGFRRVAGLVLGLGNHHRDRLSGEAHDFRRHRRPSAHLHAGAVLRRDRPAADQIADLVVDDFLSGQHPDHARHALRSRDVDALDPGMRVRAADEMRVGQAHNLDVVDVAAAPRDETPVFLAHYAGANALNTHRISPCRTASSAPKSRGRRPRSVFRISKFWPCRTRDYSAACATFMRPAASSTDLTILW